MNTEKEMLETMKRIDKNIRFFAYLTIFSLIGSVFIALLASGI